MRSISSLRISPLMGKVLVVTIGSSSTAGAGASTPDAAYPSVLQRLLAAHADIAAYTVSNKGINGDNLPGMQARLQSDVLDLDPQLVIVQAGTNDSINDPNATALPAFIDRLRNVVANLKRKAPVVLMNSQHYPSEPASYIRYQQALQQVAQEQDIALFDRYALMKSWIDSGSYRYSDILSADSFHPNDFTYRCMAQVIADATLARTVR